MENKHTPGFTTTCAHNLKKDVFFFFPKGKKRMVVDSIKVGINYTEVEVTTPSGRTIRREILNCSKVTIYL